MQKAICDKGVRFLSLEDLSNQHLEITPPPTLVYQLMMVLQINRIFVEYHSRVWRAQELADLLGWLRDARFRVWIEGKFTARQPFVRQPLSHRMELQLSISGIKEDLP